MNLEQNIYYINIEDIIPNRFQPRLTFDEEGLKELALSIKEHGIIQPLVLRKLTNSKYEIIAGERRYKASQIAGLTTVPAIIANLDDNESAEVALVENIQRRNLSAIEEAKSYKKLLDRGYLTQIELSKKLGISQSSIANKIRLLNLTDEVQDALMNEKISERHARSLLQVPDKITQIKLLNNIINNRLTVRQLDDEINKEKNNKNLIKPTYNIPIDNNKYEDEIESFELNETPYSNTIEIPTAEEFIQSNNEIKEEKISTIEEGNIESVKNTLKELEKEISSKGFDIETEEYDFEDLYQMIIKIEK